MVALELKILLLTAIYFTGWFVIEKISTLLWDRMDAAAEETGKTTSRKVPHLASVTPLDQTWRYLKGLRSPDWRIRRISCIQLADKRGTSVIEGLIEALNDPKEEVSMAAGESLAKIGDPQAIAALTDHIKALDQKYDATVERYRAA